MITNNNTRHLAINFTSYDNEGNVIELTDAESPQQKIP